MSANPNHRILLVDDNKAIHEDFRKILQGANSDSLDQVEAELFGETPTEFQLQMPRYDIQSAFQGREALQLVEKSLSENKPYALVFMDVRMPPGWDGIETTKRLWEKDADLQIVICTAYSDYSWHEMLQKLGFSDRLVILKKPFETVEVLQLAISMTEKWRLSKQAKLRLDDLEKIVKERTFALQEANVSLTQVNDQLRQYSVALADKQHRIDQELALARQVQMALLPQKYPTFAEEKEAPSVVQFAHRYLPAAELGGDYFNIISVGKSQVGILICDVMGHGAHAALITALQRVLVEDLDRLTGQPSELLGELNRRLCSFFQPLESSMYVTACYVLLDVSTGEIQYANAGHPPALHLARGKNGGIRPLLAAREAPLALGIDNESVYPTISDRVVPGDALVLYTDGVSDIHSDTEKPFLEIVKKCSALKGNAFLDGLLADANSFTGSEGFFDDVCIVSVELEKLLVLPATCES